MAGLAGARSVVSMEMAAAVAAAALVVVVVVVVAVAVVFVVVVASITHLFTASKSTIWVSAASFCMVASSDALVSAAVGAAEGELAMVS